MILFKRKAYVSGSGRKRRKVSNYRRSSLRVRRKRTRSRGSKRSSKQTRLKLAGQKPDKTIPLKTRLILDDNNPSAAATRTQYKYTLIEVPLQTSADEIDRREGLRITTRGFAVDFHIRHIAQAYATYLNIAIVIPRKTQDVVSEGFFRNWDTTRELDFAPINSWWLFNRPINKDRYEIIMHKKILVASQAEDASSTQHLPNTPSMRHVKFYQKMVRQFTFTTDGTVNEPMPFLTYWMDGVGQTSGTVAVAGVYNLQRTVRLYYIDD